MGTLCHKQLRFESLFSKEVIADFEEVWYLANRDHVWFGAGLRLRGRQESPRQTGGPGGQGRESNASGPTGNASSCGPGATKARPSPSMENFSVHIVFTGAALSLQRWMGAKV